MRDPSPIFRTDGRDFPKRFPIPGAGKRTLLQLPAGKEIRPRTYRAADMNGAVKVICIQPVTLREGKPGLLPVKRLLDDSFLHNNIPEVISHRVNSMVKIVRA